MILIRSTLTTGQDNEVPAQPRGDSCSTCEQALLLTESNHRIANSLQLISSGLSLRARRSSSPEAKAILSEAANDVHAVGRVHRLLCQVDGQGMVDVVRFLRELCADFSFFTLGESRSEISFVTETEGPVYLDAARGAQVGIIITELLTNCFKHAGTGSTRTVTTAVRAGNLEVMVSDNGPGLSDHFDMSDCSGVGMQMMLKMTAGLNGVIAPVRDRTGAHFLLTAPLLKTSLDETPQAGLAHGLAQGSAQGAAQGAEGLPA